MSGGNQVNCITINDPYSLRNERSKKNTYKPTMTNENYECNVAIYRGEDMRSSRI